MDPADYSVTGVTSNTVSTSTASATTEGFDVGVIAGVVTAVIITLVVAVVLIAVYLYKNKGSYVTNELPEEESSKPLQTEEGASEKQEYLM